MLDWRCGTGKTWRRKGGIDVTLRRHCSFVSSRIHDSRLDSCVPLIVPLCCRGNNEHRQTFLGNIVSWVLSVYWNSCKFAYNLRWDVLMVVRKKRTKILKKAFSVLDSIIVSHRHPSTLETCSTNTGWFFSSLCSIATFHLIKHCKNAGCDVQFFYFSLWVGGCGVVQTGWIFTRGDTMQRHQQRWIYDANKRSGGVGTGVGGDGGRWRAFCID